MTTFWLISTLLYFQPQIGDPNRFNNYLLMGYGVMALITIGYIVSLAVRQRNLKKDLQLMLELLDEEK